MPMAKHGSNKSPCRIIDIGIFFLFFYAVAYFVRSKLVLYLVLPSGYRVQFSKEFIYDRQSSTVKLRTCYCGCISRSYPGFMLYSLSCSYASKFEPDKLSDAPGLESFPDLSSAFPLDELDLVRVKHSIPL